MSTINVRIEEKTKRAASKVFKSMGMDLLTGVKIFLQQVIVEGGLPFRPTKVSKKLLEEWDREVAWALKHGKIYKNARDALKGL